MIHLAGYPLVVARHCEHQQFWRWLVERSLFHEGPFCRFVGTLYVVTGCNIVPSAVIIAVASPGRCDDNSPLKHCLHGFRIFQPATFDSRRMINLTRVGEIAIDGRERIRKGFASTQRLDRMRKTWKSLVFNTYQARLDFWKMFCSLENNQGLLVQCIQYCQCCLLGLHVRLLPFWALNVPVLLKFSRCNVQKKGPGETLFKIAGPNTVLEWWIFVLDSMGRRLSDLVVLRQAVAGRFWRCSKPLQKIRKISSIAD